MFNKNTKGQMFISLIVIFLTVLIFIFAAPMLFSFINLGVAGTGNASGFVIRLFPWVIIGTIAAVFWRVVGGGN